MLLPKNIEDQDTELIKLNNESLNNANFNVIKNTNFNYVRQDVPREYVKQAKDYI